MPLEQFAFNIRGATTALWRGAIDAGEFLGAMTGAITYGYEQAWNEGAAMCGNTPADRTAEEQAALNRAIVLAYGSIMGYGEFILARQRGVAKLSTTLARMALWVNGYNAVFSLAQTMSCANQKLRWELGPTREHCIDCATYAGKTYRASVWQKYGIRPQSRNLECGGWRCQCRLVPSNDPVTPGRPPAPSRGGLL